MILSKKMIFTIFYFVYNYENWQLLMDIYYDYICIWNIKYENLIIIIVTNEYYLL